MKALPAPLALTALCATSLLLARPAQAQQSEYFVMAGDQSTFHVIQGGVLLRSFGPAPGTAQYQYPLVVTSTIRTMGANAGEIGAEYDLNGNDLGPRYTHPAGSSRSWDGTTDGANNYAIDSAGGVYQFDLTWGNQVLLFNAGSIGALTYDPSNNSLWVSQFSSSTITNYSMTGNVLSTFSTGHTQNMALALDHADGTLWLHDRTSTGTFEQWSTAGALLNRIAVPGMSGQNALGGEMPAVNVARCTFRNGNNLNPADYACVTRPVLGTTWTTSFNANANTIATAIFVGAGGPATGPAFLNGELLISFAPLPILFTGTSDISLPIPNNPFLVGFTIATQGFRLDSDPAGPLYLLLNAQDIDLGF